MPYKMFRCNFSKFIPLLLLSSFLLLDSVCGHKIAFPEQPDMDKKRQNAQNRTPLYAPSRCGVNEFLYPGDQANDWICDCAPGYLFHPSTFTCHQAYRKGPCQDGEILVLPENKVIPECITNTCRNDGLVLFENKCYRLGESGLCPKPELSNVIGVNPTTLKLSCIILSVSISNRLGEEMDERFINIDLSKIPICAPGSERSIYNRCPTKIQ